MLVLGGFEIARPSATKMLVTVPATIERLEQVVVNGEAFCREGLTRLETRVAPVKFTDTHFSEVDDLVNNSSQKVSSACRTVAERHDFIPESFRQQYYKRHASQMRQMKE